MYIHMICITLSLETIVRGVLAFLASVWSSGRQTVNTAADVTILCNNVCPICFAPIAPAVHAG